ncbi:MAG: formylglycine-generating enzyme family protein, partial [Bacillota bacterium]
EFLNDAGVASNGSYEEKEVIDMGSSDCAIDYDGSFYFAGSYYVDDDEDTPVIKVTWYGALAYCNWLSEQEDLTPAYDLDNWELKDEPQNLEGYRLPTETEHEYAMRGGANGDNTTYAGSDNVDDVAWYDDNSDDKSHPVGEKQDNELDIYDMSGNVWEWTNTPDGSYRVLRGGSWNYSADLCEVDYSDYNIPSFGGSDLGFRLTKTQ